MSVRIQREDFDINAEITALKTSNVGAVVTFTGIVRRDDHLSSMTLEHYPEMTEREIARHIERGFCIAQRDARGGSRLRFRRNL